MSITGASLIIEFLQIIKLAAGIVTFEYLQQNSMFEKFGVFLLRERQRWQLNVLKWAEVRSHGDKVNRNRPDDPTIHLLEHETVGYPPFLYDDPFLLGTAQENRCKTGRVLCVTRSCGMSD